MKTFHWSRSTPRAECVDSKRQEGGSILLLVSILTLATLLLLVSVNQTTRGQIALESDSVDRLHAELLAESALFYGRSQIVSDPAWPGTKGKWVNLGDQGRFQVERLESSSTEYVNLRMTGEAGVAKAAHETVIRTGSSVEGTPLDLSRTALASLGGNVHLRDVDIYGDAVIVDSVTGVKDFDSSIQDWAYPDIREPRLNIRNLSVLGTLFSVHALGIGGIAQAHELLPDPVLMPGWNLDPYLSHGNDRLIVSDPVLNGLRTDKTVVMVVPPKQRILVANCELGGGLVIYCEPDYDLRGKPRNYIDIEDSIFAKPTGISAGYALGIHDGIGLIAPGTQLKNVRKMSSKGIFFMHSIKNLKDSLIQGGVYAVNGIHNAAQFTLERDDDNVFHYYYGSIPGMILPESELEVVKLWEAHEPTPASSDRWAVSGTGAPQLPGADTKVGNQKKPKKGKSNNGAGGRPAGTGGPTSTLGGLQF